MTQKAPFKHPECRPDEVYLGNVSSIAGASGIDTWMAMRWKSKRRGSVAYDSKGMPIILGKMFPVFASRKELEANGIDPDNMSNPYGN